MLDRVRDLAPIELLREVRERQPREAVNLDPPSPAFSSIFPVAPGSEPHGMEMIHGTCPELTWFALVEAEGEWVDAKNFKFTRLISPEWTKQK